MNDLCLFCTPITCILNRTLFGDHDEDEPSRNDEALDSDEDESEDSDEDEVDYHNDVQHVHSRHANDLTDADLAGLTEQAKKRFKSRAALIQAHKQRIVPELREEDLEERFVRGSGPGGQATNKASDLEDQDDWIALPISY